LELQAPGLDAIDADCGVRGVSEPIEAEVAQKPVLDAGLEQLAKY
jgi:hypothetical protein